MSAPTAAVQAPDSSSWPGLHISTHPAVLHKLAILRAETTEPKKFREIVRELSWLLGYEALADARIRPLTVRTPLEETQAAELGDRIGLVPILRAGLGMVDAMLELMPTAEVWHLGLFRDERTLRPVEYYNKLPDSATGTASTVTAAYDQLVAEAYLESIHGSGTFICRELPDELLRARRVPLARTLPEASIRLAVSGIENTDPLYCSAPGRTGWLNFSQWRPDLGEFPFGVVAK